jgi:serine/threonine-protein kinase GIN4
MHDTRKSDVWALGVTFFEILVGRTPFEYSEGEQFTTKEDLERYWSRTVSDVSLLLRVAD